MKSLKLFINICMVSSCTLYPATFFGNIPNIEEKISKVSKVSKNLKKPANPESIISLKEQTQNTSNKVQLITSILDRAKELIEKYGDNGLKKIAEENLKLGNYYVRVLKPDGTDVLDPNTNKSQQAGVKLKDEKGNPIVKMILEEGNSKNGGWVHYLWTQKGYFYSDWKTAKVIKAVSPSGQKYILSCGCFNLLAQDQIIVDFVDDFIELIMKKGKSSFVEFKKKSSRIIYNKSYIFILDSKGTILFDPPFPSLESRNMYDYKDYRGKYIFRDMIDLAMNKGGGWIEYYWDTPKEKEFKLMRTYVKLFKRGNQALIIGAGYFPEKKS